MTTRGSGISKRKVPLSRVKKIIKMDEDVIAVSNSALRIIASATELFTAYFAEQAYAFTVADKKKGIQYKHCAQAVARLPQLDFLDDVVPMLHRQAPSKPTPKTKEGEIPEWAKSHPAIAQKFKEAQEESREMEVDNEVSMD